MLNTNLMLDTIQSVIVECYGILYSKPGNVRCLQIINHPLLHLLCFSTAWQFVLENLREQVICQ